MNAQNLREAQETHEAKSQMYKEVGELVEYLEGSSFVASVDATDSGASIFLEVEARGNFGTLRDMIRDFEIFGSGVSGNNLKYTFEIRAEDFA